MSDLEPHFLLQAGDRAYVVYDDSSTIFHEGSSPQATRPKYIGLLQGSKTTGNWDLLWIFIGSNRPYGIITRLRDGKWSPYTSWFQIPLKDCLLAPQWDKLVMVSNQQEKAFYQTQLINDETTPIGVLTLDPRHSLNASFMLTFSAECFVVDQFRGQQSDILMSSLVAAHGGSPA